MDIFEHQSNRKAWNEAAVFYRKQFEENVEFLRSGGKNFCQPELEILEKIAPGLHRGIHLQCAAGTDTLSLLNLGVKEVVGIDISDEMIAIAHEKSTRLAAPAKWICSDVLKVSSELDESADLVYTGRGALNWLMDIEAWASTATRLLKPGGRLFVFEGHPVTYFFRMTASEIEIDPQFDGYFSPKKLESKDWPDTYVGKTKNNVEEQAIKYERAWPVSTIINSLLRSGLTLEYFGEYPDAYWLEFPNLPETLRTKFPNTFSLLFRKPLPIIPRQNA